MKNLYIRVDDFPGTKPEEFWRHNLENYKLFDSILKSRGFYYILGVIPRHVTDDDLSWLGENRVKVALHGIDHDEKFPNEFRDHQTQKQIQSSLLGAKHRLEAYCGQVDTYIPPHNVIDIKTCNALVGAGFKRLLGGPGTSNEVANFARSSGLETILSMGPLDYGRSDELLSQESAKSIAYWLNFNQSVWLTLHWTWEINIGLDSLEKYLDELVKQHGIMEQTNGQG